MSQALNNLLTLLNLEKIEEGLFRGQSEDLGLRGLRWASRWTSAVRCKGDCPGRPSGAFIPQLLFTPWR
jgi:hypothetical protein